MVNDKFIGDGSLRLHSQIVEAIKPVTMKQGDGGHSSGDQDYSTYKTAHLQNIT